MAGMVFENPEIMMIIIRTVSEPCPGVRTLPKPYLKLALEKCQVAEQNFDAKT